MSELYCCPFCGSDAASTEKAHNGNAIHGHWEWVVICGNCGARGPNDISEREARRMWNLRRPAAKLAERVARLEAALTWAMTWVDLEYGRDNQHVDPEWADNYDSAHALLTN